MSDNHRWDIDGFILFCRHRVKHLTRSITDVWWLRFGRIQAIWACKFFSLLLYISDVASLSLPVAAPTQNGWTHKRYVLLSTDLWNSRPIPRVKFNNCVEQQICFTKSIFNTQHDLNRIENYNGVDIEPSSGLQYDVLKPGISTLSFLGNNELS